jgi:hypothetical protein
MASIFIQIPAYRDFELPLTVSDCIRKASGKNQLHFGIHNCISFPEEVTLSDSTEIYAKISHSISIAPENIGLQQSRYIANEFYDDEDYYLQIDSHMRFVENWDTILVEGILRYQEMGLPKPLITQYPPTYGYDDDLKEREIVVTDFYQCGIWFGENIRQFEDTLIPSQTAMVISDNCGFISSVSGGSIFTLGGFAKIKPNRKIAFWGEEPLIAARAFTHGFDLVMPFAHTVFHLYHSQQPFEKVRRHHVWQDHGEIWTKMDTESKEEYRKIFENREVGEFALGTERTLDEYEEFAGLDFRNRKIIGTFQNRRIKS